VGSQSFSSPAAEADADGSTTVYFSPTQPTGVKRGNWIQNMPGKSFFPILRLYSPLEPLFAKTWRPSEIELVQSHAKHHRLLRRKNSTRFWIKFLNVEPRR
jgi:hypothetical protein